MFKSPRRVALYRPPQLFDAARDCRGHPHIKDQILGHAATDMSRHYTNVPQAPLIDAINQLPVPKTWRSLEGWQDPLGWSGKLVKTGKQ